MSRIFTVGETVLDIIFTGGQPSAAKAGGSMLNSAVSLGRNSMPVSLITELGNDITGSNIVQFLENNGVDISSIFRYSGTTPVALAYLNDRGDADYVFYKQFPEKRLEIRIPDFSEKDILLFGSFFALTPEVRPQLRKIVEKAQCSESIIIYDPNFRKSHAGQLAQLKPVIMENISYSTIVRGSDEDFRFIFGTDSVEMLHAAVKSQGCRILICTRNSGEITLITDSFIKNYPVPTIKPVSTIGAGDSFNAGIIAEIHEKKLTSAHLSELTSSAWDTIIERGISFATEVCHSMDNYTA